MRFMVTHEGVSMSSYSPGGILNAFAPAPNPVRTRHLVFIVYGVDYQGRKSPAHLYGAKGTILVTIEVSAEIEVVQ